VDICSNSKTTCRRSRDEGEHCYGACMIGPLQMHESYGGMAVQHTSFRRDECVGAFACMHAVSLISFGFIGTQY